ncbi:MAG: TetR/AcrR family transcriptional regulator [Sphingomonadales bacterium]|nr:TetR/AcrR family transcriptional regulator [Sphingomonadales bacterium]
MSAGDQARVAAKVAARVAAPRRSPGRPTREQAIERDRELLDTALDLFLEHGFEGTSIDAITAAVGMAKRTIYSRYEDKRGLFRAALQRAIDEWILPTDRLAAAEGPDLEASLVAIGGLLIENILSREGLRLLQITNAEARRLPGLGPWTSHLGTDPTLAFLAELFARRVPGLDPARTGDAALSFLQLVVGGPATSAAWGQEIPAGELHQRTAFNVRLFLRGIADFQA